MQNEIESNRDADGFVRPQCVCVYVCVFSLCGCRVVSTLCVHPLVSRKLTINPRPFFPTNYPRTLIHSLVVCRLPSLSYSVCLPSALNHGLPHWFQLLCVPHHR